MSMRVHKKRYMLSLLVFFALLNIAARCPLDHPLPHGSDTLAILQLSDSLNENDQAKWTLTPLSYFGLFPLSYPSGIVFLSSELVDIAGLNHNATPWVIDGFFSILLLFAGFMLFRAFRMSDETAMIFAGMMAMSPFFLYYTYGQASTRGLLAPILVIGLFFVFWKMDSMWKRIALFSFFTVLAFTLHRTAVVVLLIEGVSLAALSVVPFVFGRGRRISVAFYSFVAASGIFVLIWPFIPGLNQIYMDIPEVSSSFSEGEVEFRTGFFFEGDSPIILLANLGSNYVGSVGLVLLLLPLVILALYPQSIGSRNRDIFIMLVLMLFSFIVWRVQYMQLLVFPFFYLAVGLSVDRVKRIGRILWPLLSRIKMAGIASRLHNMSRWRPAIFALLVALSVAFSVGMLSQRGGGFLQPTIHQYNWPTDATVNTGIYVGDTDCDEFEYFISNGGILNRRIAWFSNWDCVVSDSVVLNANGYLNADKSDFYLSSEVNGDILAFLELLYKSNQVYRLNPSVNESQLYSLSMNDPYGSLRLYLEDESYATFAPQISSHTARIGVVVQSISLEDRISNPFTLEGTITCGFLTEISEKSYCICMDEEYRIYLAATQVV